jgi:hypothetical protein
VSRPRAVTTRLTERRPHGARGRGSGVSGHGGYHLGHDTKLVLHA